LSRTDRNEPWNGTFSRRFTSLIIVNSFDLQYGDVVRTSNHWHKCSPKHAKRRVTTSATHLDIFDTISTYTATFLHY